MAKPIAARPSMMITAVVLIICNMTLASRRFNNHDKC
jgi:hypothetical protein